MKILICGDSFAADWTVKYPNRKGWVNMLADQHDVTNLAQAGCSEYKIYLQLLSQNLTAYDKIIICHTSPNRIYVKEHPHHKDDKLHKNSDLIYSDLKYRDKHDPLVAYFETCFDLEYFNFIHTLICEKIDSLTKPFQILHVTNIYWDDLYKFPNSQDFAKVFEKHRGDTNHFDDQGNLLVYGKIIDWLLEK